MTTSREARTEVIQRERPTSDLATLAAWAVIALVGYGLWMGGKALWKSAANVTPTQVECHANGQEVFSGVTRNGVATSGDRRVVNDFETGREIRIDRAAVCVERELLPAEVKAL